MSKSLKTCIFAIIAILLVSVAALPGTSHASGSPAWGADYFPDVILVSHEGKSLRFFSDLLKGKAVAINFISTKDPNESAFEIARMREVQKILGDQVGKEVFIYSISLDPKNDTPQALKEYADKFQVGPGWLFLTGKEADVLELRKKFGLYRGEQGEKISDHDSRLVLGNQALGRWLKISPFENPYVLASKMGNLLHSWKQPPKNSYSDIPKVREESMGEGIFRNQCATCHPFGQLGAASSGPRLGPDLFGVTRKRSPEWLGRWMLAPDKVLAEKDPLALELLAQYNDLRMPNLGLTVDDVKALLTFFEEETNRLENRHVAPSELRFPGGSGSGNKGHH